MDATSQARSRDHYETTNDTNVDVVGNSERAAEYEREVKEKCSICVEDVKENQMHERLHCGHRYCFSCMARHVEVKLTTHSGLPTCPGCNSELTEGECENFLSSKWLEIFIKRSEEAKIPYSKRVYCPYSDCSALMHRDRCPEAHRFPATEWQECQECHRLFCIECRVPWHMGMSCQEYTSQFYGADAELHLLAENNKWKRCPCCKHMIEHSEGCIHMTCRCGTIFCYNCGVVNNNMGPQCNCSSGYTGTVLVGTWDLNLILSRDWL